MKDKYLVTALILMGFSFPAQPAVLYGIDRDSMALYRISTADASFTLIDYSQVSLGGLEFAPDGRMFGISTGSDPYLYQVDTNTAAATAIGPLGIGFVFEGGLAFAPDGTAYGVNGGNEDQPTLFRINVTTGNATVVGVISGAPHDLGGIGWRSDGLLVALDRASNALLTIDPATAASSVLLPLEMTVGDIGGMTVVGDAGYFNTAGAGATIPGSSQLFWFNALTGEHTLVGSFSPLQSSAGISGLALAPDEAPQPQLLIALLQGEASLSWTGMVTHLYQLESSTAVDGTAWVKEGVPFPGNGILTTTNVPIGLERQKFFRLHVVQ